MSWDAYITDNLMAPVDSNGTTLTSAALLGQDGSVWATSSEFPAITPEEVTGFLTSMNAPGTALHIAGVKYLYQSGDDKVLRCRKDKDGIIARKTNSAIVVGIYTEPKVSPPTCAKVVESLADYLEQQGY